jgi:hypothetical protein
MSHISSSRMPHAYAAPEPDASDRGTDIANVGAAAGKLPFAAWLAGAIGVGAAGAAAYAVFGRPTGSKKAGAKRPSKPRQSRKAA